MTSDARSRSFLFATCFIALIATSSGFIVRAMLLDNVWAGDFDLSKTQVGEIFGAGLWPFAISIVLFSLVIDKIGYKTAMWFAVVCHSVQAFMLMTPGASFVPESLQGYWWLWIGSFIGALGNGTIEAVINPVIATVYSKSKTRWLTILHAGWPGGLVLGGLLALSSGSLGFAWQWQVAVILLPVAIYALMLINTTFPINERVAAAVPYQTMLRQAGMFGALIVVGLIVFELGRVFGLAQGVSLAITLGIVIMYGIAIRGAPGRLLFILLLLLMIPLATVELGTDGWIKALMGPAMADIGLDGIWVLIYTATIMMLMRIFAIGPLSKFLSPLGILAVSSLMAALGIWSLGSATGAILILVTATIYGMGQAFFWPCTLGLVSEQFPEGGALTINAIAGVGMLGVGIIGAPLLGNVQDTRIDQSLQANDTVLVEFLAEQPKESIFGTYRQLDNTKITVLADRIKVLETSRDDEDEATGYADAEAEELELLSAHKATLDEVERDAAAFGLRFAALPALFMSLCYGLIILYFKSRGGYRPVVI